jgi:hypothetical protein
MLYISVTYACLQLKQEYSVSLYLFFLGLFALAGVVPVGDVIPSVRAALNAVQQHIFDDREPYRLLGLTNSFKNWS